MNVIIRYNDSLDLNELKKQCKIKYTNKFAKRIYATTNTSLHFIKLIKGVEDITQDKTGVFDF